MLYKAQASEIPSENLGSTYQNQIVRNSGRNWTRTSDLTDNDRAFIEKKGTRKGKCYILTGGYW